MDVTTITGILMALGGVVWGAWSWVKAKAPKAVNGLEDAVESVLKRIQATTDSSGAAPVAPSRMEALEHLESLMQFMEANGNKAGADALVSILKEILTKKA